MTTHATSTTPEVADPYALDPADIQAPPTTMRERFRHLGPAMIMSAAVVGSGELITTTTMGARVGFALLWLIVVSTGVKVWVQMELATWSILAGKPALEGYAKVPPRFGRAGWINILWICMDFAKMLQRGGIIGGTVAAFSLLWPITGEPLSTASTTVWTVIIVSGVIAVMARNRYRMIERTCFVLVVCFTVITVLLALGLPLTEFGYGWTEIGSGFSFTIPAGAIGIAVAVFGLTGVGADEMTSYTYWCIEKGYARWTGPDDGTPERAARAEGWIKVMRLDVFIGWLICVLCTLSFYLIGAAVLHPQGLVPAGNDVIVTLSRMYTDTLGGWAHYLFLIGAIATLGSTFIASTASVPRLWANNLGTFGLLDWSDVTKRNRLIRIFTMTMPLIWAATYLGIQSPLIMVMIGGIGGAVFLLAVVIAVWYLRYRDVPRRFRANRWLTAALVISSLAISALAVISLLDVFGISLGA